jgi:tetratricopeptide (TPR) repeat protein
MARYVAAWNSGNPFNLVDLQAPGSNAFVELLGQARFDRLLATSVLVRDLEVQDTGGGALTLIFTKDHEELFLDGTVSRGLARVRLNLSPRGLVVSRQLVHSDEHIPAYSTTEKHFFAASKLMRDERYEAALEALDAALETQKSLTLRNGKQRYQAQLQYFRAVCLIRVKQKEAAMGALNQALTLNPEFPMALNQLAEQHLAEGELMAALDLLRKSLELNPLQPTTHDLRDFVARALTHMRSDGQRRLYLSLRKLPSRVALETARAQMKKTPENHEWQRIVAVLMLDISLPEDAEKVLLQGGLGWEDPETLYLLAQSALAQGKESLALKRFNEVWKLEPDYRNSVVYITELNSRQKRWRAAVAILKEALSKRPSAPELLFKLGVYSLRMGRRFEALSYFKKARSAKPSHELRQTLHKLIQQI